MQNLFQDNVANENPLGFEHRLGRLNRVQPRTTLRGDCSIPEKQTNATKNLKAEKDPKEISLPALGHKGRSIRGSDLDPVTQPTPPPRRPAAPQPILEQLQEVRPTHEEQCERSLVEIVPGYSVAMIGVRESLQAYRSSRCLQYDCTSCKVFLYCIDAATMVLCPVCKTISPLTPSGQAADVMGVGLTIEHLLEGSSYYI